MSWLFGSSSSSSSTSSTAPARAEASVPSQAEEEAKCPVDHSTRARWLQQNDSGSPHPFAGAASSSLGTTPTKAAPARAPVLSNDRETSTIPRHLEGNSGSDSKNWVYPSPSQFFTALQRKNRNPNAQDMDTVVPIHNAVNERTWHEVLKWEAEANAGNTDKVELVSFKGRPQDRTPRAWWKVLLGYQAPFDRHDWIISRNGQKIRYVIDFYTGRRASAALPAGVPPQLAFYLDVRPAIDNFESVRMRVRRSLNKLFGLQAGVQQDRQKS